MKVTTHSRRILRLHDVLFVVLFLVVIGLLGWLSTRYVYEADWTASGRHTLSETSVIMLRELPGEMSVTVFVRETPVLRRHIVELVGRYQRHKPDLEFAIINPDREPRMARELNITAEGEMIIEYQGRSEQLREPSEQALTNALQRLARGDERRLRFISGHGERDPAGEATHDMSGWARQLHAKGIEADRINLVQTPEIPANTAALVIAAPQAELLPGSVAIIQDYVAKGGNLLWLADPDGSLYGLEPLAEQLGIRFKKGMVVDPTVSQVGQMLFGTDDPRVALVASYPPHEITRGFDRNTLFPIAGALAVDEVGDWQVMAILKTLSGTWLETGEVMGTLSYDEGMDVPGPLTLGMALTRERDEAGGADEEGLGKPGAGDSPQRVVVIADSDFLSNGFLGLGGNLQLGLNIANWLVSDERFIDIPAQTVPDSSLQLSSLSIALIGFGFMLVLPAILLGSGLIIWFRRRRR